MTGPDGQFEELLSLADALEVTHGFEPFGPEVADPVTGRTVVQVRDVAYAACLGLEGALRKAGVPFDSVDGPWRRRGQVWSVVYLLAHGLWVGHDSDYWSCRPGDPLVAHAVDVDWQPSPFWVSRFSEPIDASLRGVVEARRARLDALGATRPIPVPIGAPRAVVVDGLLEMTVAHLCRVAAGLSRDPGAIKSAGVAAAESSRDDGGSVDELEVP